MDIFTRIWQSIETMRCCLQGSLDRLVESEAPNATTADIASQIAGTTDYTDPALLSISISNISGDVTLNTIPIPVGGTAEFTAEPGALLSGAFSLYVDGDALITRTFRS